MISLFLILLSLIFLFTSIKIIFKTSKPTYDHYAHLSFIKDIQLNKHSFISKNSNVIEEKNFAYPLLYHWLIGFLPFDLVKKKYLRLNGITEIILYSIAAFLALSYSNFLQLNHLGLIFFLIVTNPFNRFVWNAKASGISPRNFGIILAYIYLFIYSFPGLSNQILLQAILLSVMSLIIILSSQFSTQYLIIFSVFNLFILHLVPLISLFVGIILFAILFPATFKSYIKGQWEHKKIWYKHLAKIDLLNNRPSVYRDFIYDFYKKRSLKYFLTNPIIEALLGFPLIIVLFFVAPESLFKNPVILSAFIAFAITSLRYTRAFGEPQRYLEMALPGLVFLALEYLTVEQLYLMVAINLLLYIIHINIFVKFFEKPKFTDEIIKNIADKILNISSKEKPLLLANDASYLGYFLPYKNLNLLLPTFTCWIQYGFPITKVFPKHVFLVDEEVVIAWLERYRPEWFFLDDYHWPVNSFENTLNAVGYKYIKYLEFSPLYLYQIIYRDNV